MYLTSTKKVNERLVKIKIQIRFKMFYFTIFDVWSIMFHKFHNYLTYMGEEKHQIRLKHFSIIKNLNRKNKIYSNLVFDPFFKAVPFEYNKIYNQQGKNPDNFNIKLKI